MVVGFAAQDGHSAVDLLDGQEADHLVTERHFAERYFSVGAAIDGGGETIWSAYHQHHIAPCGHLLLQVLRKLYGAVFGTVFVEQNKVGGGRNGFEYQFPFGLFLLLLGERLGVFEFGDDRYVKRYIVCEPPAVFVDEGLQTRIGGLAYYKEGNLHCSVAVRNAKVLLLREKYKFLWEKCG